MRLMVMPVLLALLLSGSARAWEGGFAATVTPEARTHLVRADRALLDEDLPLAVAEFEKALAIAPDYAPPYAYYAFALSSVDRGAAARAAEKHRELAEAEPQSAAHWYAYGRLEQERSKREAAFRRVVDLEPGSPWGHLGLGFAARATGDRDSALPHYERAFELAPTEPSVLSGLAALYSSIPGRQADARKRLIELFSVAPNTFLADNTFEAYANAVDRQELMSIAEVYVRQNPGGRNLGMAYLLVLEHADNQAPETAGARAREALERLVNPRFSAARGEIFEKYALQPASRMGRAAVVKLAADTTASKESSPHVFFALGRAHLATPADPSAAAMLLGKAHDLYETNHYSTAMFGAVLRLDYGRALEQAGDLRNAARVLELVPRDSFNGVEVATALEGIYSRLNDRERAFAASVRVVALRPLPELRARLAATAKAAGKTPADVDRAVWAHRDLVAKPSADFTLRTLDGRVVSLSSLRGKPVLLNFWFPACPPCRLEFPHLQAIYAKYRARGLEIVAVEVSGDLAAARKYIAERKVDFTVLAGDWAMAGKLYGVVSAPSTFLIDSQGKVIFSHNGFNANSGPAMLVAEVEALLERGSVRTAAAP